MPWAHGTHAPDTIVSGQSTDIENAVRMETAAPELDGPSPTSPQPTRCSPRAPASQAQHPQRGGPSPTMTPYFVPRRLDRRAAGGDAARGRSSAGSSAASNEVPLSATRELRVRSVPRLRRRRRGSRRSFAEAPGPILAAPRDAARLSSRRRTPEFRGCRGASRTRRRIELEAALRDAPIARSSGHRQRRLSPPRVCARATAMSHQDVADNEVRARSAAASGFGLRDHDRRRALGGAACLPDPATTDGSP